MLKTRKFDASVHLETFRKTRGDNTSTVSTDFREENHLNFLSFIIILTIYQWSTNTGIIHAIEAYYQSYPALSKLPQLTVSHLRNNVRKNGVIIY